MEKPMFELEMVGYFDDDFYCMPVDELEPDSAAQAALKDNLFAEVIIPYHTDNAIYGYTFHLFGIMNNEPAINEMAFLLSIIEQVHQDYHQLTKPFPAF